MALVATTVLAVSACASQMPVTTTGPASTAPAVPGDDQAPPSVVTPPMPVPPSPVPTTSSFPDSPVVPDGDDTAVESVVDGDTIVITGGTRVRLIGIDTPETKDPRKPVQCFGLEAAAYTSSLLAPGTAVRLVYDVERLDRYGRTLAYVYRLSDGILVNAALVADGYAQVATFPPNVAHTEELTQLARMAREEGRGLWSACGGEAGAPEPPSAGIAPPPVARGGSGSCDPSYPDACIPSAPPDLDCGDIAERRFRVLPPDPHGFDGRNGDGLGCES